MKKLEIKLNQDYKSFNSGFSCELVGDLILVSGVNGSGKSQLANIIDQFDESLPGPDQTIQTNVLLDDNTISMKDVLKKSFKNCISVGEIGNAGYGNRTSNAQQAWSNYNQNRLDLSNPNLAQFQKSAKEACSILQSRFQERFRSGVLSEAEVQRAILESDDFIWQSDDIFSNQIAQIFFNYAGKVSVGQKKVGREGGKAYDSSVLGPPPWKTLNKLLELLSIDYGFRDDYEVDDYTGQLNYIPELYARTNKTEVDLSSPRRLADLSDGEKAIISLVFAATSGVTSTHKKIILLDEFDAALNPSLIKVFYKILEKYFLNNDILVVIITHSPATLSLAPEYATFYELFRQATGSGKVLPAQRGEYAELKVANEQFYKQISNQKQRIVDLIKENEWLVEQKEMLLGTEKPVVFCEGKTDIEYMKSAVSKLGTEPGYEVKWIGKEIRGGDINSGYKGLDGLKNLMKANPELIKHKVVLIYDCDISPQQSDYSFNQNIGNLAVRRIPKNVAGLIGKGIENLLPNELIESIFNDDKSLMIKRITESQDGQSIEYCVVNNKKVHLQKLVCKLKDKAVFSGFDSVFRVVEEAIKSIK